MQTGLQFVLVLLIWSMSGAGHFTGEGYSAYLTQGWYVEAEAHNSVAFIGSFASLAAIGLAPFVLTLPRIMLPAQMLFAFMLYVAISGFWSNVPLETFYSVAKGAAYTAALTYLVAKLDYPRLLWAVVASAWIIGLGSAILAASDPIFASSVGADGWRGLFMHKNGLGAFCLFMIVLLFPMGVVGRRTNKRAARWTVGFLFFTLLMSQSKTGIALALAYMVIGYTLLKLSNGRSRKWLYWVTCLVWMLFALIAVPVLIDLIATGDVTFTGRTTFWSYFIQDFLEKPLLGWGGSTIPFDEAFKTRSMSLIGAPAPDSSFVVLLINIGILGFILYLTLLWIFARYFYHSNNKYGLFGLCALLVFIIYGAMESGSQFGITLATLTLLTLAGISNRSRTIRRAGRSGAGGDCSSTMRV